MVLVLHVVAHDLYEKSLAICYHSHPLHFIRLALRNMSIKQFYDDTRKTAKTSWDRL